MTPSRLVLAFSCVSFGVLLTRCGGEDCKENCDGPLVGLTVIAPDQLAEATCAPAQIVRLDGGATVRPTRDVRLGLSGGAAWFADSRCLVPATSATQEAGSRGAVAYLSAKSAGRLTAQARGSDAGGEAVVEARPIGGAYTSIRVGGVRYTDVASCVPIYVAAADSAGAPASVGGGITVTLSAPGTTFFETEGCTSSRNTFILTPGHESAIAYARFGLPGETTVTASVGGNAQGTAQVDVAGDPQYRVLITPSADTALVQAGECKPFALAIVDPLGAPISVNGIDVAVRGNEASVFADAACGGAPITTARVSGTTPTTVYVRANKVGSATFTASLSEAVSRTIQLQVSAAAASALRLGGPPRLSQNGCYPFVVERVDAFGNLVNGPAITTTVSSSLGMFTDGACTGATTSVGIPLGEAVGYFFVRGASLGNDVGIGATATGLTAANKTVDVLAVATAFRMELGSAATAGQCVAGKLFAINGDGVESDVLTAESPTIAPTPSGLTRYSDIHCTVIQSTVTIPALGSQANFYVRSTQAQSYTVATTGGSLTAAPSRNLDVSAGPLAQTDVSGPDRVNFRSCTPIYADFYDQFGNSVTLSNGRLLGVEVTDFGGVYDNPLCAGSPQDEVFVPTGTSSTIVYYRGEHFGNDQVFVGGDDVSPDSVAFEVLLFMGDTRIGLGDLPSVKEVAMRPDGSTFYAQTTSGMVYASSDNGATWSPQCTTRSNTTLGEVGHIFVSPGPDAIAYVSDQYNNYVRVDSLDGGNCPNIRSQFNTYLYALWQTSGVSVDYQGGLWLWNTNQLYYSSNYGSSWTLQYTEPAVSTSYTAHMTHSPLDSNIKLADFYYASVGSGLYQSLNGAGSFTATGAAGFADATSIPRFDPAPAHAGYVYKVGRQSVDNGATWTANAGYNGLSISWALDSSGAAYRFTGTGTTTVIERAPDARTPAWAALTDGSFTEPFDTYVATMAVSNSGNTIAVQSAGHLYVTTDAGANFDPIDNPETLAERNPALVVTSATDAFAASGGNPTLIYATNDSGVSWSRVGEYAAGDALFFHVNPNYPRTVYLRRESFGGTYDGDVWATQDGFDNVIHNTDGSPETWWGVGAVSLRDPLVFYTLGNGICRRTLDGGMSYEDHACDVPSTWYAGAAGWVSPFSQDTVFVAAYDWNLGGPYLWSVNWATGVRTQLTTPGYPIAGLEMYEGPSGPVMRVADAYGRLQSSVDGGQTFTELTNGVFDSYCYYGRSVTSLPGRPEVVATGCHYYENVAISVDGGNTWESRNLPGCQIRQISLLDGVAVVACLNNTPRTFEYGSVF